MAKYLQPPTEKKKKRKWEKQKNQKSKIKELWGRRKGLTSKELIIWTCGKRHSAEKPWVCLERREDTPPMLGDRAENQARLGRALKGYLCMFSQKNLNFITILLVIHTILLSHLSSCYTVVAWHTRQMSQQSVNVEPTLPFVVQVWKQYTLN